LPEPASVPFGTALGGGSIESAAGFSEKGESAMHRMSLFPVALLFIIPFSNAFAQENPVLSVQLKNHYSGKCLAVKGGSKEHGATLIHKECGTESPDAIWHLRTDGKGFRIVNGNSGLCLGLRHQSKSDGALVTQVTACDRPDTLWRLDTTTPTPSTQPLAVDFVAPTVVRNYYSNKCLALVTGDQIKQYGCPPHRAKTTWQVLEVRSARAVPPSEKRVPLDPLRRGITVLTYNTHLFGASSAEVGDWLKNDLPRFFEGTLHERTDPLVFEDDKRARLIVERIRNSGADIVGLQEVWASRRQGWFCDQLGDIYPYRYHPPEVAFDPRILQIIRGSPAGLVNSAMGIISSGKTTSGLVLLSKYKLKNVAFTPFPSRSLKDIGDEEFWAKKGVVTATVELWDGGPTFRLGVSHACTDVGGLQQPDMRQIAQLTCGGSGNGESGGRNSPAIMMGDFNVNGVQPAMYDLMKSHFQQAGAMDAFKQVYPEIKDDSDKTANVWDNLLYRLFNPRKVKSSRAPDILDYVFFRKSGGGLSVTPVEAEVLRDWSYKTNRGWWQDVFADKWSSSYVAVVSFQLNGHPHLFGLKTNDTAYISRINDDGRGWTDIYKGRWDSNYKGTAITTFSLDGHPHIFALKRNNTAYISRINDDGMGWKDIHRGKWASNYVAVVSFQLRGHPYLFGLKSNNTAYVSRINDDGKGWTDVYRGKWASSYVGTAIAPFYLHGHPYLFALKKNNTAYISRINDDGRGWKDIASGKWASNYIAVRAFELDGHPYLFGLKANNTAYVSRINDDGRGWRDIYQGEWSSNYVGTAITTFNLKVGEDDVARPYMYSLKGLPYNQGWITRFGDETNTIMDLSDHYPLMIRFKVSQVTRPE
jgi:endonuclease/exonuclease/phosphatase family metal-dependent hydrolase